MKTQHTIETVDIPMLENARDAYFETSGTLGQMLPPACPMKT